MKKTLVAALSGLAVWLALGPAAPAAEDVIFYTPNENHFIVDWLLSSRHRFPFAYLGAALNFDALAATGGEKDCAPRPGVKAGAGSDWEERHFKPGGYAAGACVFTPCPFSFTYAFAYLYCDREHPDLEMLTGSDDGLLALLNGQIVQRVQMQRGYATDQDRAVVTLRQGWNRLLCKVDDYSGGHGLCVRFRKAGGEFFSDYKVCFIQPAEGAAVRFVDGVAYEAEAAKLLKDAMKLQAEKGELDAAAEKALAQLVADHPDSSLASEAMLRLAVLQTARKDLDAADVSLGEVRRKFPNTVEAVKALKGLADNLAARGKATEAAKLYRQVIEECQRLSEGKYVFFVNVQAVLKQISDSARHLLDGFVAPN
jgi:hypothetical protein